MNRLFVSSPTDRLIRGGGSVVVSSAGAIALTPLTGQALTITAGNITVSNGGSLIMTNAITAGGTLTVSGAGPHTFSGPVKVSGAFGTVHRSYQTNATDDGTFAFVDVQRAGAVRARQSLAITTNDVIMYTATGSSGSETYTEAIRIVNANAYVRIPTRLMVGAASDPSYPLHVTSQVSSTSIYAEGRIRGGATAAASIAIAGVASEVSANAAKFEQTIASATAPILVVKGGATPTATGLLASLRNSADAEQFGIGATGQIRSNQFDATATVGAQLDRFPVYNASGTLVGYVPVYAAA